MKEKDFDCVQMKWDIQQKLLEEENRLGIDEARRVRQDRLRADPILGPFLQRLLEHQRRKASEAVEQLASQI